MIEELWAIAGHMTTALLYGLAPTLVIALITGLLCWLGSWRRQMLPYGIAFGLLGAVVGLLLGASREPVVKAVIPAIITLVGGFVAYMFPKSDTAASLMSGMDEAQKPDFTRSFVLVAVSSLALSSIMGANFGASIRAANEAYDRDLARAQLIFEQIELPLERAQLERALGISLPAADQPAPSAPPSAP